MKITGTTWKKFIEELEENTRFEVDAADAVEYSSWIRLYDSDGDTYFAEVTKYSDGEYELQTYNIVRA